MPTGIRQDRAALRVGAQAHTPINTPNHEYLRIEKRDWNKFSMVLGHRVPHGQPATGTGAGVKRTSRPSRLSDVPGAYLQGRCTARLSLEPEGASSTRPRGTQASRSQRLAAPKPNRQQGKPQEQGGSSAQMSDEGAEATQHGEQHRERRGSVSADGQRSPHTRDPARNDRVHNFLIELADSASEETVRHGQTADERRAVEEGARVPVAVPGVALRP